MPQSWETLKKRSTREVVIDQVGESRTDGIIAPRKTFGYSPYWIEAEEVEIALSALRDELARYQRAMANHLCEYEMTDWLACVCDHGKGACIVCEGTGESQHFHEQLTALRDRAERAEEQVAAYLNKDGLAACGHYAVFTLQCVKEDGSEYPCCMQCDRDAAQDRAERAEALNEQLTQEKAVSLAQANELCIAHATLDETRARVTSGQPVWRRFEWLKTLIIRERDEAVSARLAAEADTESLRQQMAATEHRRVQAENFADGMRMRCEAAEAALQQLRQSRGETTGGQE